MRRIFPLATLLALSVSASDARAQQAPAGWDAFLGCWVATDAEDSSLQTCFLPVAGRPLTIERLTVRNDSIVLRSEMTLGGVRQPLVSEGCDGYETARASEDGARVYFVGEISCGTLRQHSAGLMSVAPHGEVIRVTSVEVGEQRALVSERFFAVPEAQLPSVVQDRVRASALRARGARIAAAKLLDYGQIEDALDHTESVVVEAWMVEATRDTTGFTAPLRELRRLAARQAPTGVIDMAVMIANPQRFDVYADEAEVTYASSVYTPTDGLNRCYSMAGLMPIAEIVYYGGWNPVFFTRPWDVYSDCTMYAFWSRNAFIPSAWGYWYPGSIGGYGYYRRYWGDRVVYVPATGGGRAPRPQSLGVVEKGRGYTQSPARTGSGGARPRDAESPAVRQPASVRSNGGSSSGSGSSGVSGATRSRGGSATGTGRTAQPRKPAEKKP